MVTLTKTMRDKLTPKHALEMLEAGNNRFVTNLKLNRNLLQQVNETCDEQYPFAFILSCIDSRTSAELIFDQGLGDIFSCRIAGNILNDDIIGSMEFACKIAGAKIVVVLGHTECGAIKGACNHLKMGHLTGLLDKISVVINETDEAKIADKSQYYDSVSKANVKNVLKQIKEKSPIINELIAYEKIILVGAMYDISSGVVEFY